MSEQSIPKKLTPLQIQRAKYVQRLFRSKTNPRQLLNFKDKLGRNEPCTCGSGKKYKYCCLKKIQKRWQKVRELQLERIEREQRKQSKTDTGKQTEGRPELETVSEEDIVRAVADQS